MNGYTVKNASKWDVSVLKKSDATESSYGTIEEEYFDIDRNSARS